MSPTFESRWGFKRSCPVIKVERVKWKIGGCRGWLWANTSLSLHRNGRLSSSWGGSKWQLGAPRVKAPAWARPINTKNDGCVTTQRSGRSVTPGWTEEVGLSSWRTLNYTPSPLLFILNPLPPSLSDSRGWGVPLNYTLVLPWRQRRWEGQERRWTLHKNHEIIKYNNRSW